jgi:hypothetical protein
VVFGFLKKKKQPAPRARGPLEAYDGVIEALERQGAQVRKSAATLLAMRGELQRERERCAARLKDIAGRLELAVSRADASAEKTLQRDKAEAQRRAAEAEAAQAKAEADAKLLAHAAHSLAQKLSNLKEERTSAKVRLTAGLEVSAALKAEVEQFDRVVALDAARDEVERAHALAELYREEKER